MDIAAQLADGDAGVIFSDALQTFQSSLTETQREAFCLATQDQVKLQILKTQSDQEKSRTMQNLPRVYPFLKSFGEFDEVCKEINTGVDDLSAFIWGPTKYALQMAKEDAHVLDTVLDTYFEFGKRLPHLAHYKHRIKDHSAMKTCLAYMYQDLLRFHDRLLSLFKERVWKKIFHPNMKDLKGEFKTISRSFEDHGRLLKELVAVHKSQCSERSNQRMNEQATKSIRTLDGVEQRLEFMGQTLRVDQQRRNDQFVTSMETLDEINQKIGDLVLEHEKDRSERLKRDEESESRRRDEEYLAVLSWISARHKLQTEYHEQRVAIRAEFPETGNWILEHDKVWPWVNEDIPTQSMIWINGKKGAGKTVLASHIIEHCKTKKDRTTSYFYCREDDDTQNTCLAMCKSLLRQLLMSHRKLLPTCYEKRKNGGETLEDLNTAKSLVDLFCDVDIDQFIVIDGLDECASAQRRYIIEFLNNAVNRCDGLRAGKIRVLIVSTDQADTRKMMHSASILDLNLLKTQQDIHCYVASQVVKLQDPNTFGLDEADSLTVEQLVCARANGMFLFASLVMENLMEQPTVGYLKSELSKNTFPQTLKDAYDRIIKRLRRDLNENQWTVAVKLFGWLACAKRPLKIHEIQAALSLREGEDGDDLDYYHERLTSDIRKICGPLIHVLEGCRVEFSHSFAKKHVICNGNINVTTIECDLAVVCMRYLSMPCFVGQGVASENYIDMGSYALQDYAVSQWHRHIESLIQKASAIFGDGELGPVYRQKVTATLSKFVATYKRGLTAEPEQKKGRGSQQQQQQADGPQHDPTEELQAFCAAFEQYDFHSDLLLVWTHIYKHQNTDFKTRNKVSIPELSTSLTKIRDALEARVRQSGNKLEIYYGCNLFKCPRVTCYYFHEGFPTRTAAENHNNRHDRPFRCVVRACAIAPFGFPTNKDLDSHVRAYHPDEGDVTTAPLSPFAQLGRRVIEETKFQCELCHKNFTRGANLKAHRDSHFNIRSYQCGTCGRAFTRANDRTRHENTVHKRRVRR